MNINPEIKKILQQYNITEGSGTLYLLSLYHELPDGLFSEMLKKQINLSKIVERDYTTPGKLIWNTPLYTSEVVSDQWDWIQGWRDLFGKLRNDAIGSKKGCIVKMKKFFAEHPEIRVSDINKATMLYLTPFYNKRQDPKYLQQADYFISKIIKAEGGTQYGSRLEMYLEVLSKEQEKTPLVEKQMGQIVK
jgi:hypothetical protein